MKSSKWLVVASMGLASACVTVRSSPAPGVNFERYRTFAWVRPTDPEAAQVQRSPAGQTIRHEIAKNLYQKGIAETTSGHPDFLVGYHFVVQDKIKTWGHANWGGGGWGWGPDPFEYTEGTIIVDFIDPRTNDVFWWGTASRDVNPPVDLDLPRVSSAVDKLMTKYRARGASAGARAGG